MPPIKREWSKPRLIVLVRGTPEEYILAICKTHNDPSAPGRSNSTCKPGENLNPPCSEACRGVTGT